MQEQLYCGFTKHCTDMLALRLQLFCVIKVVQNDLPRLYKDICPMIVKAVRIISLSKYNAHADPIFKQLIILKVIDRLHAQEWKNCLNWKHSFSQRTINEWNKLSTDCVTASSVNMFKNKVDTYLRRAGYK